MPLISWTPTNLTFTSVAKSGSNAIYHYSSYTGRTPVVGMRMTTSGFTNASNNIFWITTVGVAPAVLHGQITNVDLVGQTVTIVNASAVNETHAGTGTLDSFVQGLELVPALSSGASASPWVLTYPVTPLAGNLLLVFAATLNSSTASATISDTGGHTWTLLSRQTGSVSYGAIDAAKPSTLWLWSAISNGSPSAVTVTSGTLLGDLLIYECQGPLTLDQVAGQFFTSAVGIDPLTAPPITPAFSNELVIGFFDHDMLSNTAGQGANPFHSMGMGIFGSYQLVGAASVDATTPVLETPTLLVDAQSGPPILWGAVTTAWIRGAYSSGISGNAGVAGATVTLSGDASATTTADGSGNYSFTGLANGNYVVTPSLAFYTFSPASRSETITGSDITGVNFTAIPDTWSISGNAGIAGATVTYTGTASGSVSADGSGNYTISGLSNGAYTITPSLGSYVFSPSNRSETISNANITGVNFTVSAEVEIAEVQISVTYQNPGNYLYARDVDSWGDGGVFGANNGQPYALCNVVIGSISLSQPGARLFPLQHVVGYFDAVGTLHNGGSSYPEVWIMPNEISDKKGIGFVYLPEVLQEPPVGQNQPSTSILALRYPVNMMNSTLASQFVHHLQVKIQFEPENAKNTIKALAFMEDQST